MTKIWQPLKVDSIGNAVLVNGALLHEDMYRMDMLNRALADFCNANAAYRVRQLMAWMYNDTLVRMMVPSTERVPVVTLKNTYECCLAEADPLAGFALLRSASMVNVLVELVYRYCGNDTGEDARAMVLNHLPERLLVKLDVGSQMRTMLAINMTASDFDKVVMPQPPSGILYEERCMWYAAELGLLPVAASLLADCLLMGGLAHMLHDKLTKDGRWHAKEEVDYIYTTWRRDLLARQMQAMLVKMTGSRFAQTGMSREDAESLLKAENTLTAVA
ncbi:MAG: hypothetical protein EON60_10655 [Alphaproteobacteria bacterium]|nr:MAG: hypothetical protein EON60_10655 [Alphaproteobacteria bacterium]